MLSKHLSNLPITLTILFAPFEDAFVALLPCLGTGTTWLQRIVGRRLGDGGCLCRTLTGRFFAIGIARHLIKSPIEGNGYACTMDLGP